MPKELIFLYFSPPCATVKELPFRENKKGFWPWPKRVRSAFKRANMRCFLASQTQKQRVPEPCLRKTARFSDADIRFAALLPPTVLCTTILMRKSLRSLTRCSTDITPQAQRCTLPDTGGVVRCAKRFLRVLASRIFVLTRTRQEPIPNAGISGRKKQRSRCTYCVFFFTQCISPPAHTIARSRNERDRCAENVPCGVITSTSVLPDTTALRMPGICHVSFSRATA